MNLLFFLTPKSEVAYIFDDDSVRQVLEKMEHHKYGAIPIIDRKGGYVGTLTEGDLLWGIKNQLHLDLKASEDLQITKIHRRMDNTPVNINANMEDLIVKSLKQNFVPVIDDKKVFIGIVTRKDIIQYCYNRLKDSDVQVKDLLAVANS